MLVLHIRQSLMKQKITTQREALEITMKLESSLVGETRVGINHIQSQLENMTIQLQDIKNGKETREDVWCTRCHTEGHHKYRCPNFCNYLMSGTPNRLIQGGLPWYHIFQTHGHQHEECIYLQKAV